MKQFLLITAILFLSLAGIAQSYEIYVSDAAQPWQIYQYDQNGDNGAVFIGTSQMAWPQDILFLEDRGEVLISSLNSDRVTRHDAETGAFLSNFTTLVDGPTRMKFGPDSLIYILEWNSDGDVFRFQKDGTFVDIFTSEGTFQSIGLCWDDNDNLYVSSYGNSQVNRYNTDGVLQEAFITSGLNGPTNIEFNAEGEMIVLNWNNGQVKRYSAGGSLLSTIITGVGQCEGLVILGNGDMIIGAGQDGSIQRFEADGTFIEKVVESNAAGLNQPNAVILRGDTSTDLHDTPDRPEIAVTSIGEAFYLLNEEPAAVDRIEVYDTQGRLIHNGPVSSTLLWDATAQASGIYFLRLFGNNRWLDTEKVTVGR